MLKNKKFIFSLFFILFIIILTIGFFIYKKYSVIEATSRYGSRGDEVIQIQTKLKRWGYYNGSIDGIYGTKTVNAVKYFQRKNGLTEDRNSWSKNSFSNGNYNI